MKKIFFVFLLGVLGISANAQVSNAPSKSPVSRPKQIGRFDEINVTDKFVLNKGVWYGKALEIDSGKIFQYLLPSTQAVYNYGQDIKTELLDSISVAGGADGNGIYGGSGSVPNNTYAQTAASNAAARDSVFAIGYWPLFPSDPNYSYNTTGIKKNSDGIFITNGDSSTQFLSQIIVGYPFEIYNSFENESISGIDFYPESYFSFVNNWQGDKGSELLMDTTTFRISTYGGPSLAFSINNDSGTSGEALVSDGSGNVVWGPTGIYGGSGLIPDTTYMQFGNNWNDAQGTATKKWAIGQFPNFPTNLQGNGLGYDGQYRSMYLSIRSDSVYAAGGNPEYGSLLFMDRDYTDLSWSYGNGYFGSYQNRFIAENSYTMMQSQTTLGGFINNFIRVDTVGVAVSLNSDVGTAGEALVSDGAGNVVWGEMKKMGQVNTTTDANGDITVTHGLPDATFITNVTITGTVDYFVTVHSKDATTFKTRIYDATTGAALGAGVTVTFDWLAFDF